MRLNRIHTWYVHLCSFLLVKNPSQELELNMDDTPIKLVKTQVFKSHLRQKILKTQCLNALDILNVFQTVNGVQRVMGLIH